MNHNKFFGLFRVNLGSKWIMYKNLILPASILAGTIIGAGVFALPYVFLKAGLAIGLFYLIAFGITFILTHLMYADVILKTEGEHRFVGYAQIYLKNVGRWISLFVTVLGMIMVLTVYLILSISFLNLIIPDRADIYKPFILWLVSSAAIFWSIKRLSFAEFLATAGILGIMLVIFFYGLGAVSNIKTPIVNLSYIFLPYGVILFALDGRVGVPALIDYFKKNNQPLDKVKEAIILGTSLPAIIYFLFVLGILSLSKTVSPDTVSGLMGHLPPPVLWLLGILGLISLWSTYIVIGQDVRKSLEYDLKFSPAWAALTMIFLPLILYLLGFGNFLGIVGLIGGIFIGLEGVIIVLMWRKSKKLTQGSLILKKLNPSTPYILLLIFILGIITTLIGK